MYSLDSTVSSDEFQSCSDHSDAESSSRSSSNDTEEQVINYDDSVEPVPTQEEVAHYVEQLALEDEEEQTLLSRFSGEENVRDWYVDVLFAILSKQERFTSVAPENPPQFHLTSGQFIPRRLIAIKPKPSLGLALLSQVIAPP